MENDKADGELSVKSCNDIDDGVDGGPALNSTVLNYYKKFGRKRDLEQYFSLSTAQSEIRDPTSSFWRRIKAMSDTSDSGEKRSDSPTELCRISIKCTNLESPSSQEYATRKSDSESPPIVTEDVQADTSKHSDNESLKSDDNVSQKSMDAILDNSANKLLSPSSSITSQRKLEWDSLADVGYANETDCKNSASSLSTLERLALKQQYSNNDTQSPNIGGPTAHSTPLDENDSKLKGKSVSKTTKIFRKDTDFIQVNMPCGSDINKQAINVNLTKHISFNMDGDHRITRDVTKDICVHPETMPGQGEAGNTPIVIDKEIQTTLNTKKDKSTSSVEMPRSVVPVLINLNSLRRKQRKKKVHHKKSKLRIKRKESNKENTPVQEKSGEQVSEAESFEYMPGHIYNQNQMKRHESNPKISADNKSSLESSGNFTTDSSKGSKHSFTKDLQKSLTLLKATLNKKHDNSSLKQNLIKEVVQRLLKSSYRDDESTTDFLSGLSFGSVKLGMSEATTTSTSEGNTTEKRPKKSILRNDKFNSSLITSTSQSAPNLPSVMNSEKPITTSLKNPLLSSNTESDVSSREKNKFNIPCSKTQSEELYQKYLDALQREQAYKKHLKDKEMFLKQKLVCSSNNVLKMPAHLDSKVQTKLKDLMKDLTRNNYDDGSGDASVLEARSNSNSAPKYSRIRKQRSHSVFTLSSGEFQCSKRKDNSHKTANENKAGPSRDDHNSCCPSHKDNGKVVVTDSSTQVDVRCQNDESYSMKCKIGCQCNKVTHYVSDSATGDIKYVCFCPDSVDPEIGTEKILVYKCSRLTEKTISIPEQIEKACKTASIDNTTCTTAKAGPSNKTGGKKAVKVEKQKRFFDDSNKLSKCSQTNLAKLFNEHSSKRATPCDSLKETNDPDMYYVHEATRQLQTEISINPRISDPSLCDIKLMGSTDCAKLISEQYRQVSKSSLGKTSSEVTTKDQKALPMGSEISDDTSVSSDIKEKLHHLRKMTDTKNSVEQHPSDFEKMDPFVPEEIQDNLTIPIQGTNMTLMVKIGQNTYKPSQEDIKTVHARDCGIQTPEISPHENGIPHHESFGDNSKSYGVNTLFAQNKSSFKALSCDDTPSDTSKNLEKGCGIQNDLLDDFFATESQKFEKGNSSMQYVECKSAFNTYPKAQHENFIRPTPDKNKLQTVGFKVTCDCQDPGCSCNQGSELEEKEPHHPNTITETADDGFFFKPLKYLSENLPKMRNYPCPEPAACGNRCDETADCCDASRRQESLKKYPTCMKAPKPVVANAQTQCLTKPECPCPEMAVCGRTCDETEECFQNATKAGARRLSYAKEPVGPTQRQCLKNPVCPCPETAVCGRTCDEKAECIQIATKSSVKPLVYSQKSAQKQCLKRPEFPCPEMATCAKTCDDTAKCFETRSSAKSPIHAKERAKPNQIQCLKKPDCPCPDCGRTCDETAVFCQTVKSSAKPPVYAKEPAKANQSQCLKKPECLSPEIADCGDDETAEGFQTTKTRAKSPIHAQKAAEAAHRQGLKLPECPCPEMAVCGGTCDETAEYFQNVKKSSAKPSHTNDTPRTRQKYEKGNIMQTQPFEIRSLEVQKESATSSSNSDNSQHSGIKSLPVISDDQIQSSNKPSQLGQFAELETSKNFIIELINDITKRFTKKDMQKGQQKKCFSEIMKILNYLLDTDDQDQNVLKTIHNATSDSEQDIKNKVLFRCATSSNSASFTTASCSKSESAEAAPKPKKQDADSQKTDKKKYVDKGIQQSMKKCRPTKSCTESSDVPISSECACTSSDATTCKILSRIRKECERYHQKRCKFYPSTTKCETSSSASVNCEICKRSHHCHCRTHKCKSKPKLVLDKAKRKCVAYNLIIQTSESMVSEETSFNEGRPLRNIIVKVPPKRKLENMPFKEVEAKIERHLESPRYLGRFQRSRSCPNESGISSADEMRRTNVYSIKEYLERNRPDFVEQASKRQNCLRLISESRNPVPCAPPSLKMVVVHPNTYDNSGGCSQPVTMYCEGVPQQCTCTDPYNMHMRQMNKQVTRIAKDRQFQRDLLSMQLLTQWEGRPPLSAVSETDLTQLARDLGADVRRKREAPKFISEREMKKHSENIYKTLPEVVRKKDELKKQHIKKTNLLMASIFNKNLQKKTLRGAVNLSNYSNVVKI